jgi:hypothetical protein
MCTVSVFKVFKVFWYKIATEGLGMEVHTQLIKYTVYLEDYFAEFFSYYLRC